MNLISCNNCGIVLDKDRLDFPEDIKLEDRSIDSSRATWTGEEYFAYIRCPVCNNSIIDYES